jgi:Na+-transporting NADH:ubiquinone oxidoreductase subunit C
MSNNNDTIKKTLGVVISLSLVCSIVVSSAAVVLRPKQQENALLDVQRNILSVAGLLQKGDDASQVGETYGRYIEPKLVDLKSGAFLEQTPQGVTPALYDQRAAAKDPLQSVKLAAEQDPGKIISRANIAKVYLVKDAQGDVDQIILPVHGNGLWSMMYAFVSIKTDGDTINGLTYYQQGETPGLGGEVENIKWRAQFTGKKLYNEQNEPAIRIVKGGAKANDPYAVDGLSGATLTGNGVQGTFNFWLGDMGYGPFLTKVREGDLLNG